MKEEITPIISQMKAKQSPPSKASPLRFRKTLSLPGMLKQMRSAFGKIVDSCKGADYALSDVMMPGLAIFGLKYASLLQFDEKRSEPRIRANLAHLYGVTADFSLIDRTMFWRSK